MEYYDFHDFLLKRNGKRDFIWSKNGLVQFGIDENVEN